MADYVVTDDGDKVLPGSRRPDGTIRKERRIRAGYTPQDEQPVYQSVGVMVRVWCLPGCTAARHPEQQQQRQQRSSSIHSAVTHLFSMAAGKAGRAKVPRLRPRT